jgi:hypothetical protein
MMLFFILLQKVLKVWRRNVELCGINPVMTQNFASLQKCGANKKENTNRCSLFQKRVYSHFKLSINFSFSFT